MTDKRKFHNGPRQLRHKIEMEEALKEIECIPCSMVNDSDSLRHTIKTIKYIASEALMGRRTTEQ